jgi:iron(III) transport system substrate-binding protein
VKVSNPALEAMGSFRVDPLPIALAGANQTQVQQMLDRVGYK